MNYCRLLQNLLLRNQVRTSPYYVATSFKPALLTRCSNIERMLPTLKLWAQLSFWAAVLLLSNTVAYVQLLAEGPANDGNLPEAPAVASSSRWQANQATALAQGKPVHCSSEGDRSSDCSLPHALVDVRLLPLHTAALTVGLAAGRSEGPFSPTQNHDEGAGGGI